VPLTGELGSARVGKVRRDVGNRLAFVIEVRGDDQFACVSSRGAVVCIRSLRLQPRCEVRTDVFEFRPEAFAQNLAYFDRSRLQEDVGAST